METRLFRLVLVLSCFSLLGFGSLCIERELQARTNHDLILQIIGDNRDRANKCLSSPPPCDATPYFEAVVDQAIGRRSAASHEAKNYFFLATGIPAGLLLLFFAGQWIFRGKLTKPKLFNSEHQK